MDEAFLLEHNLTCSVSDFRMYRNMLEIPEVTFQSQLYSFDELYNWVHKIENPTTNTDAKYYVLRFEFDWHDGIYIQNCIPFINWYKVILDCNYEEVLSNHKEHIKSRLIDWYTLTKTIEHFRNI